jgi:transcriptional regulator with XRE-family HTH domain
VETIHTQRHARLVKLLVTARKQAGIRQAELARRMGITQPIVARFEAGQRRIEFVELLDLCKILGINPYEACRELLKIENELWQRRADRSGR